MSEGPYEHTNSRGNGRVRAATRKFGLVLPTHQPGHRIHASRTSCARTDRPTAERRVDDGRTATPHLCPYSLQPDDLSKNVYLANLRDPGSDDHGSAMIIVPRS